MGGATGMRRRRPPAAPIALAAVGCLLAALASLLLRAGPQYDPIGWLLWGRQLWHGDLNTLWYPSWKPLPVLVTAPAALAGHGALPLWVLTERAVALAGVVVGARIAWRSGGPLAAAFAAVAVVLLPLWSRLWLAGTIEPVVAALLLGAVAAALARRDGVALVLLALAALGRVDAWPLLLLAAVWCWWRGSARITGPLLVALVPAAWLVGDWAGSGDAMRGGVLARIAAIPPPDRGVPPVLAVLHHVPQIVPLPVLAAAVATAAWGIARRRAAETMLAAIAAVWVATDLVLAWRGYPTDPRFLVPPGAATVVLAAIGAGRVLAALPDRRVAQALAAAAVVLALVVRAPAIHDEVAQAAAAITRVEQLDSAIGWAGGPRTIAACGGAATTQPFRARLAWNLDRPTAAVVAVRRYGLLFLPPGPRPPGLPLRRRQDVRLHRVARVDGWTILRVAPPHAPPAAGCRPGPRWREVQLQRSVRGASRIRSMRAGTPPTTAFSGTSPATTA